jgi:hypothetical protein
MEASNVSLHNELPILSTMGDKKLVLTKAIASDGAHATHTMQPPNVSTKCLYKKTFLLSQFG